jgi:hypothetical protein
MQVLLGLSASESDNAVRPKAAYWLPSNWSIRIRSEPFNRMDELGEAFQNSVPFSGVPCVVLEARCFAA